MEMFPLPYPSSSATSTELIDALMVVYGARDVFMGLAIYAAAAFGGSGGRKGLGWVLLAAGGVAGVDGWVVRGWEAGRGAAGGEWNHWGYAPFVGGLGMWLAMGR